MQVISLTYRFPAELSPIVYNNEVVDNIGALKDAMEDEKKDTVHGKIIEAFVSMSEDTYTIKITKVKQRSVNSDFINVQSTILDYDKSVEILYFRLCVR